LSRGQKKNTTREDQVHHLLVLKRKKEGGEADFICPQAGGRPEKKASDASFRTRREKKPCSGGEAKRGALRSEGRPLPKLLIPGRDF